MTRCGGYQCNTRRTRQGENGRYEESKGLAALRVTYTIFLSVYFAAGEQIAWMQPPPESAPGCPPGLEYLTQIDQLIVAQQVELVEGEPSRAASCTRASLCSCTVVTLPMHCHHVYCCLALHYRSRSNASCIIFLLSCLEAFRSDSVGEKLFSVCFIQLVCFHLFVRFKLMYICCHVASL